MASVRCLKCGKLVEGLSQMCAECTEDKRANEQAMFQQATAAAVMPCPWCDATMPRAAARCPTCFREPQDFRTHAQGLESMQRGDFWVRLVAWIIDAVILSVVNTPIQLLFPPALVFVVGLGIGIGYTVYFLSQKGATPGKMVMGLRVVDGDGRFLSPMHAIGRYFSHFVSVITLGIGYLMIFGEQRLGLHDRVSGSQVVLAKSLPQLRPDPVAQPTAP